MSKKRCYHRDNCSSKKLSSMYQQLGETREKHKKFEYYAFPWLSPLLPSSLATRCSHFPQPQLPSPPRFAYPSTPFLQAGQAFLLFKRRQQKNVCLYVLNLPRKNSYTNATKTLSPFESKRGVPQKMQHGHRHTMDTERSTHARCNRMQSKRKKEQVIIKLCTKKTNA